MANDSSTGGPLLPSSDSPVPLEGTALLDFIQTWVVGLTGLDSDYVRPYWMGTPPNIPDAGTCFCALGVKRRPNDTFPYIVHLGAADSGLGEDQMIREEELDLLASFYDRGVEGQADFYASLCRDGASVTQNSEVLHNANFVMGRVDTPIVVPSLLKERWLYRVDLEIHLRRAILRNYPVRNIVSADVEIITRKTTQQGTTETDTQGFVGPPS